MTETREEFGTKLASSFGLPYKYLKHFCDTLYDIKQIEDGITLKKDDTSITNEEDLPATKAIKEYRKGNL